MYLSMYSMSPVNSSTVLQTRLLRLGGLLHTSSVSGLYSIHIVTVCSWTLTVGKVWLQFFCLCFVCPCFPVVPLFLSLFSSHSSWSSLPSFYVHSPPLMRWYIMFVMLLTRLLEVNSAPSTSPTNQFFAPSSINMLSQTPGFHLFYVNENAFRQEKVRYVICICACLFNRHAHIQGVQNY